MRRSISAVGLAATVLAAGVVWLGDGPRCQAFLLADAANYAVLYEGAGSHNLQLSGDSGVTGNVGLGSLNGGTPQLQLSGGTITGSVVFSGTQNISYGGGSITGTIYSGSLPGGNTVNADLTALNSMSATLGAESGTPLALNNFTGPGNSQTVNVSDGMSDGNGNRIFTVTSLNWNNNDELIINGDGSSDVVFNIGSNAQFKGTIVLTGGITSDQVLFNLYGGSNFTGGPTLQFSANGDTETGVFLDPNGDIQANSVTLYYARLWGGDEQDMQIVSGAYLTAPPNDGPGPPPSPFSSTAMPEPSTASLCLLALGSCGISLQRRRWR